MQKCRSYFEDLVVTEPVDTDMVVRYTQESGTVQRQDSGVRTRDKKSHLNWCRKEL